MAALSFTLTRARVTLAEQSVFAADLDRLGVDGTIWMILNGTLEIRTAGTVLRVLRAYRGDALVGVAYVMECRKLGRCFFDGPVATVMDTPGLPMFVWLRGGFMTDATANPGFVAPGLERDAFATEANAYLQRRYLYGVVMDEPAAKPASNYVTWPLFDAGHIVLGGMTSVEDYLARGKNLRRKVSKFKNKGDRVEELRGPMPPAIQAEALRCFDSVRPLVILPYQDSYATMSMRACSHVSDRLVHVIAWLDNALVGYQSFAISGRGLHCLSGAFDRSRASTYHAYENIIIDSVRFGLEHGLQFIDYGPITNDTKAKMMTAYRRAESRVYSRFAPLRTLMPWLVQRSKLAPAAYQAYIGIASSTPTAT